MPPSALIFILQSFIHHILLDASISSHLHPPTSITSFLMHPSALIFILQSFIHHILVHGSISSHLHPPIIYPSHPCSCLHQLSSSSSNHLSITSLFMPPPALIFILQSFIQHILVHASTSSHLHPPIIYPSHPPCLHQLSSSSSNHLSITSFLMPPSALIFILQSFIHHILVHSSISSHLHPPIIYPSHPCSCLHQLSSSSSNHLSITSLFMPPSALIFILQPFIHHILVHASISSHLHPPIIWDHQERFSSSHNNVMSLL